MLHSHMLKFLMLKSNLDIRLMAYLHLLGFPHSRPSFLIYSDGERPAQDIATQFGVEQRRAPLKVGVLERGADLLDRLLRILRNGRIEIW